jgi:hypothetical protein
LDPGEFLHILAHRLRHSRRSEHRSGKGGCDEHLDDFSPFHVITSRLVTQSFNSQGPPRVAWRKTGDLQVFVKKDVFLNGTAS